LNEIGGSHAIRILFLFILALRLGPVALHAQAILNRAPVLDQIKNPNVQRFAKLPLSFERYSDSRFVARGKDYSVDVGGPRAIINLVGFISKVNPGGTAFGGEDNSGNGICPRTAGYRDRRQEVARQSQLHTRERPPEMAA
jgi:hypothetical protein